MIMKTLHFGIEMEMTGITRSRAASLMASFFGTESRHEGGAYDTYTARDEQGRKWKAMNDSSLVPQKKVNGNITDASSFYRTEVVSPILSYEDITKLQELVRTLRKAGAFANKSCGIHIPFGQGFKDMSPPSKELFKLLMEGNILHGGNPVLKWMAGNVVMRQDPAGNIKPDKEKSVEKIDGIVASIMALDRCIRNGIGSGSVYDERGVIAF